MTLPTASTPPRPETTPKSAPLFGQSRDQLRQLLTSLGEPPYRAAQLAEAIYANRIDDLAAITTLPARLRQHLANAGYTVGLPQIAETFTSVDGTERYLIRMADGETVETVWMPNGDGGEAGDGSDADDLTDSDHRGPNLAARPARIASTICLSSQVGCAVNCQFCFTAKLGVRRNLTPGEIAGQVAAVLNRHKVVLGSPRDGIDPARINLVFMGMGEPFLNYDAFIAAVRLLVEEIGIPESRMTVSTSGIVPAIERFASESVRPKLAISLNAPNDDLREQVMPINRKWNVAAIMDAVAKLQLRPKERVTFEYVLLGGVNDRPEDAAQVATLLRRANLPLKLNLIAWNAGPGIPYATPNAAAVTKFQRDLINAGIPTYIRRPRGRDIYAACGQLKRTTTPELVLPALTN